MHIANQQLLRTALLGLGFFFLFAGYNSLTNMEKTFLLSLQKDVPSFHGDGYIAQSIVYAVFAITLWLAPSVISITGPRLAMFFSAIGYEVFILSLFIPLTWVTYLSSIMAGCMAAILWTGHVNYLVLNSEPYMIAKCAGLFSAIFQLSMFPGNLFVYFKFHNIKYIDVETRKSILIVLAGIISIGVIIIGLARPPHRTSTFDANLDEHLSHKKRGPIQALKKLWTTFFLKEVVALYFIYGATGLLLAFNHVVSASIGFTQHFGDTRKRYVPLAGFFCGLGGVVGAILPFFVTTKKNFLFLRPLTFIAMVTIILGLLLSYLVLPEDALFGDTTTRPFVESNVAVALMISTLLGIGENSFTNEMTDLVGTLFPNDSAQAFAALLFLKNICVAIGFYISNYIGLYTQIYVMSIFTFVGTIGLTWAGYLLALRQGQHPSLKGPQLHAEISPGTINSADSLK
ncbi:unnamed protein product [Bemisia tabaci]|uniref:UNC93-like protein MFSD11 n=1 Tax=Bemisia tabaci TaxID=7038 RepID=A0A9P0A204_BEMTA|nr:unnamed protein product [Bemisia tabaci]